MTKYEYTGPVYVFDQLVAEKWHGETYAVSEKKARSNLAYQWKQQNSRMAYAGKVILSGKLEIGGTIGD